jgi:hypothetical protein
VGICIGAASDEAIPSRPAPKQRQGVEVLMQMTCGTLERRISWVDEANCENEQIIYARRRYFMPDCW